MNPQDRTVWATSHFVRAYAKGGSGIPSTVGPIRPMILIIMSLFIMSGVGVVANSLVSSGLLSLSAPPSSPVNLCNLSNYLNCYYGYNYNVKTGCDQNPANCQIGGSSGAITILNPNSAFTPLFTGNLQGFSQYLTTGGASSGQTSASYSTPYQITGGGNYFPVNCQKAAGKQDWNSMVINGCSLLNPQSDVNYTSVGAAKGALNMSNWNYPSYQANETQHTTLFGQDASVTNSTFALFCTQPNSLNSVTYLGTTNQTDLPSNGIGTTGSWAYYGCDIAAIGGAAPGCPSLGTVNTAGCSFFSFLVSVNVGTIGSGGSTPLPNLVGAAHFTAYVQATPWDTGFCLTYVQGITPQYASSPCSTVVGSLYSKTASGLSNFSVIAPIIGFLFGILILIAGTGVNLRFGGSVLGTGTTMGMGINTQGTRLAQALGLGLIVWIPLFSEFGGWLSSAAILPGLQTFISFVITGTFFFGIFWQFLSFN